MSLPSSLCHGNQCCENLGCPYTTAQLQDKQFAPIWHIGLNEWLFVLKRLSIQPLLFPSACAIGPVCGLVGADIVFIFVLISYYHIKHCTCFLTGTKPSVMRSEELGVVIVLNSKFGFITFSFRHFDNHRLPKV